MFIFYDSPSSPFAKSMILSGPCPFSASETVAHFSRDPGFYHWNYLPAFLAPAIVDPASDSSLAAHVNALFGFHGFPPEIKE